MIISTITFGIGVIISSKNTKILTHDHCQHSPIINFTNNISYVTNTICDLIISAKRRVILIISTENNDDSFAFFNNSIKIFLEPLIVARENGASLLVYFKNSNFYIRNWTNYYKIPIYDFSDSEESLEFNAFIADDTSYIVNPTFKSNQRYFQLLSFPFCSVVSDDIIGFVSYFQKHLNGTLPRVLPPSLYASSSAFRPTLFDDDNSHAFFFHTPDRVSAPLRIDEGQILHQVFTSSLKECFIFSAIPPKIPSYQWRQGDQYSFYLELRSLVMQGTTKVHFLANMTKKPANNLGLLAYDNFEMRYYEPEFAGPHFIIADQMVYAFSFEIDTYKMNNFFSLHFRSNSSKMNTKFREFFEKVWKVSATINISWDGN